MEPVSKRDYSTEQRRTLADQGKALPDGSFPIVDKADLANAIQSIGRAHNPDLAKKHILRRAEALDAMDMLPDSMTKASGLVSALQVLLANSVSVYHEAHGYHWNVKGQDFSQYHSLFSDIYGDIYDSIDPIAENILKMGDDAPFHLSEFMNLRTVQEGKPANEPVAMAKELLNQLDQLLASLNNAFAASQAENQQGIANFIADRIDMTQKWTWQLRSSVGLQKSAEETADLPMADQIILKNLRGRLDITDEQWDLVVKAVEEAGSIRAVRGTARELIIKAAKTK
jgi:starvation-inducible DNA-binding protein